MRIEDDLDSNLNKLRALAVLELIRRELEDDIGAEVGGDYFGFVHITALYLVMMEARGLCGGSLDELRQKVMTSLDIGEHELFWAREKAIEGLAEGITGNGIQIARRDVVAPF